MSPKEEIIKLIEDLPDDATIDDIMAELHIWTKTDNIPLVGQEKASSHQRRGRWLN